MTSTCLELLPRSEFIKKYPPSVADQFYPTAGRLLVRRTKGAKASEIIIAPDTSKLKFCEAEVLAVGPARDDGPEPAVEVGDVIYFGRWTDWEEGETALIQESDVVLKRYTFASFDRVIPATLWQEAGLLDAKKCTLWSPIHDRIIVKPDDDWQKSGLLFIPQNADSTRRGAQTTRKGKVLAVGTGNFEHGHSYPLQTKVGDTVLFYESNRQEFTLNGETLLVMRDLDVLGVIA